MPTFTNTVIVLKDIRIVGFIVMITDANHDKGDQQDEQNRDAYIDIEVGGVLRL